VDTLSWVAPNQMVLSAVRLQEEGDEAPDAFPMLLAWPSAEVSGSLLPHQDQMKLTTFTPYMVEVQSCDTSHVHTSLKLSLKCQYY
jgi:hypothetical protein